MSGRSVFFATYCTSSLVIPVTTLLIVRQLKLEHEHKNKYQLVID